MFSIIKLTNFVKSSFTKSNISAIEQGDLIIKRQQKYLPFYDIVSPELTIRKLSSHFPMAVISLMHMGASQQQLIEFEKEFFSRKNHFYELQVPAQEVSPEKMLINENNIDKYIGHYEFYELFYQFFAFQSKTHSMEQLIAKYLPKFSKGIGAEAYHLIIKLGYSVIYKLEKEEVLQSIAYFACQNVTLDYSKFKGTETNIFQILKNIQKNKETFVNKTTFNKGMVFNFQMNYLLNDDEFLNYLPKERIQFSLDMIPALQEYLLKLFIHTKCSFILLHAITGLSALKQTFYLFNEQEKLKLINDYLISLIVFFASDKSQVTDVKYLNPEQDMSIPQNLKSWDEIKAEAVKRFDDHDIKLSFVCYDESKEILKKDPNSKLAKLFQYAAQSQLDI